MTSSVLETRFIAGESIGVVIKAPTESHSFQRGVGMIRKALASGAVVFVYLLDQAAEGVECSHVQMVQKLGAKISVCAFALDKGGIECPETMVPSGLTMMSDILLHSKRAFIFN